MFNALEPWHLLIIVGVLVVLFGAKRLPGSARSLGHSLRIFRSEMAQGKAEQPDTDATPELARTHQASGVSPAGSASASIQTQPSPPVSAR